MSLQKDKLICPGPTDSQQTAKSDRSRNEALANVLEISGHELPKDKKSAICDIHHSKGKGSSIWPEEKPTPPENMPVTFPLINITVLKLLQLGDEANSSRYSNESRYMMLDNVLATLGGSFVDMHGSAKN